MHENVLKILKDRDKPLNIYEIKDLLGLNSPAELRELQCTLYELEKNYDVYRSKKDRYIMLEKSHLKKGRLSVHKSGRFGFVIVEGVEDDIRIDESRMNGAIHNDTVIVEVDKPKTNEGKVLKVIERDNTDLVGEYYIKNGVGYVKMDNPRYKDYLINLEDSKGAMPGHKVLVRRKKEVNKELFQGEIVTIIGHKNDVGVDILSLVYEYGIPHIFTEEVMKEAESIPNKISPGDLIGRRDLRNQTIITIDPPTAKDLDQAIGARREENGNYTVTVNIADVTKYVDDKSEIGKEAYNRGNSVYLVNGVIPNLPHRLSNGICSLNEGEDRLTLTCEMCIDTKGNIVKHDIYLAVINSRKKMSYDAANKILDNNEVPEGYEEYVDLIKLFKEIGDALHKNRVAHGYLDFDTDEMEIKVDENGKPIEIGRRPNGTAEKFNEQLMIAANETVDIFLHYLGIDSLHRVHEKPDEIRIRQFITFINSLGYRLKGKSKNFDAYAMQDILKMLQKDESWRVLSNLALRTMKKARYSPENLGHFGLGEKFYSHFTAPIRRESDRIIHRILKAALGIPGYRKYSFEELTIMGDHVSLTEDRSVKCERAVGKMKAAEFMEGHIDEEYDAIISSISRDGIWVQLDNLIEGLIRVSEIGNDYFDFDENIQIMKGRKTGKTYRIGEKIRVVVTGASKADSEIDFAFVKNTDKK